MNDYLETELDKLNRMFRCKIINVITTPTLFGAIEPSGVPFFSTGIFLEATETGIFTISMSDARKWKKDFFYHDKIIKLEEVGLVSTGEIPSNEREILESTAKQYEERRKTEIDSANKERENVPDNPDPKDQKQTVDMLSKIQKMIIDRKTDKDPHSFLDQRVNPIKE